MAIEIPSFDEFVEIVRAELRRNIPTIDPTVFGSWSRGFTDGVAAAAFALGLSIEDLQLQLFPQTAQGDFLDLWGNYEGLERNPATAASGLIVITGTNGTTIPIGTEFVSSTGFFYDTAAAATISNNPVTINSITRSGSIATATVDGGHNLASGVLVDISGADQSEYNGTDIEITVISETQFTYTVSGTPATPATGTIQFVAETASVLVDALLTGVDTNLGGNAPITLVNAITGVDNTAFTQINGLTGGADIEQDGPYRSRILLSRSTIEGVFTEDQIITAALSFSGNTRAFVKRPTVPGGGDAEDPSPGQVSVWIMRDNDPGQIPDQSILDQTKALIEADGALPAHMAQADLFVEAPTLVPVDIEIGSLDPNEQTMKDAIELQLKAFFADSVQFEDNVTVNSLVSAIQTTQDTATGDFIKAFSLDDPLIDVTINAGQIGTLGTITFT
jgi:uncharacterized phage protein gp47/JayE